MAERVSALPDPAYDSRFQLGALSISMGPAYDRASVESAQTAFAAANPGMSYPSAQELQPYFRDPAM
ncbi:MAG TPA: hypothetical protein VHC86_15620, partial [Opitutaceae bacterium]|nr:hypothetical protein [Opitutaceae bacterium]